MTDEGAAAPKQTAPEEAPQRIAFDPYQLSTRAGFNSEAAVRGIALVHIAALLLSGMIREASAVDRSEAALEQLKKLSGATEILTAAIRKYSKDVELFAQKIGVTPNAEKRPEDVLLTNYSNALLETTQLQSTLAEVITFELQGPLSQGSKSHVRTLAEVQRKYQTARDEYDALKKKELRYVTEADTPEKKKFELELHHAEKSYEQASLLYHHKLKEVQTTSSSVIAQSFGILFEQHIKNLELQLAVLQAAAPAVKAAREATESSKAEIMKHALLEVLPPSHKRPGSRELDPRDLQTKQGYLVKKNKMKDTMKWVVVSPDTISWSTAFRDKHMETSMTLLLCSIRPEGPEKPNCFRITSPERTVLFQASTANELDEWLKFISNAIASNHSGGGGGNSGSTRSEPRLVGSAGEANGTDNVGATNGKGQVMADLRAVHPSNSLCADCGRKDPEWASIVTGSLICIDCSGIHRSFGVHISKVRSLLLDKWEPDLVEFLKKLSNEQVNAVYEARVAEFPTLVKPTPTTDRNAKEVFLTGKYVERAFVPKTTLLSDDLNLSLWAAAFSGNYPSVLLHLAQGADINWNNPDMENRCLLHELVRRTDTALLEYITLRARLDSQDLYGRTPLHAAVVAHRLDCVRVLLHKGAKKTLKDRTDETPYSLAVRVGAPQELLDELGTDSPARELVSGTSSTSAVSSPTPSSPITATPTSPASASSPASPATTSPATSSPTPHALSTRREKQRSVYGSVRGVLGLDKKDKDKIEGEEKRERSSTRGSQGGAAAPVISRPLQQSQILAVKAGEPLPPDSVPTSPPPQPPRAAAEPPATFDAPPYSRTSIAGKPVAMDFSHGFGPAPAPPTTPSPRGVPHHHSNGNAALAASTPSASSHSPPSLTLTSASMATTPVSPTSPHAPAAEAPSLSSSNKPVVPPKPKNMRSSAAAAMRSILPGSGKEAK